MQLDTVILPDNYYWSDEKVFKPFATSKQRAVNGALTIEAAQLLYGRPITLSGMWISRADLAVLEAMESEPDVKRLLIMDDSTEYTVLFDLEEGGVEAEPLHPTKNPDDTTIYTLTLHLITVEPE